MPKEITLDELVTSNTTDVPIPQRQQRAIVKESPNNGARVMTVAQVEDNLVSAGKMQRKEEVTVLLGVTILSRNWLVKCLKHTE